MKRTSTTMIVIHCAATKPGMDIGRKEIEAWHFARGFVEIGYHYVIRRNGTIELGRQIDEQGAHVQGYNSKSIGICLVGGLDANGKPDANFTEEQMESARILCYGLQRKYKGAQVLGHRDIPGVAKECPCYDVRGWYEGGA